MSRIFVSEKMKVYKVIAFRNKGAVKRLYSCTATNSALALQYKLNQPTFVRPEMAKLDLGIAIFSELCNVNSFLRFFPRERISVYKGIAKNLWWPPNWKSVSISDHRDYTYEQWVNYLNCIGSKAGLNWPEGTLMCEELTLIKKVESKFLPYL